MSSQLTVKAVDHNENYYHVRFRDDDAVGDLETPDWASELARSELPGSEVRLGQDDTDEWLVQRVRVPVSLADGEGDAARKALQVVTVISEHQATGSE